MDITPQDDTTKPISDDQELAKALAGVLPDEPQSPALPTETSTGLQFEETPAPIQPTVAVTPVPVAPPEPLGSLDSFASFDAANLDTTASDTSSLSSPVILNDSTSHSSQKDDVPKDTSDLSGVKADALEELRPLIDKLNLPPEEKFDAYLLLIRNTDDVTLIPAAHAAAQAITDEARKAQALLDVIKEINYLSNVQADSDAE